MKHFWNSQLPFKNHHVVIGDNYESSPVHLNSILMRQKKEPSLLQDYHQIIKEQLIQKWLRSGRCHVG